MIYDLKYSDTHYERLLVALTSFFYGLALILGPSMDNYVMSHAHPHAMILPLGYKIVVGSLFMTIGVANIWRLTDPRGRVAWATLINLCAASLWLTITASNMLVYGQMVASNVCEIMITITALYVLIRTDSTIIDKGSA